jgi:uncharacterized protein (DUF2062 family)
MPRRFFKKFAPHPDRIRGGKILGRLGKVLHQPSLWHLNRHSASRGVAAGMFWSFIPIPGQTLFAVLTAIKSRGNVALSVLTPWIFPFILSPLFYLEYYLGCLILHRPRMQDFWQHVINLDWTWISAQWGAILPLIVGSVPVAALLAAISYFVVHGIWRWSLMRRWNKRTQRLRTETQQRQVDLVGSASRTS